MADRGSNKGNRRNKPKGNIKTARSTGTVQPPASAPVPPDVKENQTVAPMPAETSTSGIQPQDSSPTPLNRVVAPVPVETNLPKNNTKQKTASTPPMAIPGRPNYRSYRKRNPPKKTSNTKSMSGNQPSILVSPSPPSLLSDLVTREPGREEEIASSIDSNQGIEQITLSTNHPAMTSSAERRIKGLPPHVQRDATGIIPSPLAKSPNYSYYRRQKSKRSPSTSKVGSPVVENRIAPASSPTGDSTEEKPKKVIKVVKTNKFYDNEPSAIPIYKTSSNNRGEVLIINNILFEEANYRHGAEVDDENMEQLFSDMGFGVHKERNMKAEELKNRIQEFSKSPSLTTADICILILMSHGTNNRVSGGYTEIFGSDDEVISTDQLFEYFNAENCPQMAHKPKIFIFQCCRGDNLAFTRCDAVPIKSTLKDMLIAYSTLPGFTSLRDVDNGTWYIQTICEVFSEHAHQHHVEDLLKLVDEKLGEKDTKVRQTSSYESRGFKKCFLHPV